MGRIPLVIKLYFQIVSLHFKTCFCLHTSKPAINIHRYSYPLNGFKGERNVNEPSESSSESLFQQLLSIKKVLKCLMLSNPIFTKNTSQSTLGHGWPWSYIPYKPWSLTLKMFLTLFSVVGNGLLWDNWSNLTRRRHLPLLSRRVKLLLLTTDAVRAK